MAFGSQKSTTRRSGKIDVLIACRVPARNGTHTTSTRRAGSGMRLKILLCTQLAPARHVVQVGEKSKTRRGWPSSRLNCDFKVLTVVSEMTPPWDGVLAGPLLEAEVHKASRKPAAIA